MAAREDTVSCCRQGQSITGIVPLAVVRVVVLRGPSRVGRRRRGVARARAGAEPARRASAAHAHARDRHALALRRAHQYQEGPVGGRHPVPGREVRLPAAAASDAAAGRAGARGGASGATVHRAATGPEALSSFQQLKSESKRVG